MLAGTLPLIRLILRRDRMKLPLWIAAFVGLLLMMIPLLREVYGDAASLQALHASFGANPAGLFMTGPIDEPSFGALITIETLLWWGAAIAFLNTLLVVRHTRHNEEIGAQELLLSGQVHRSSSLFAALFVALLVNIAIVLGLGFGMSLLESSWTNQQAWLFAFAMGLFGFSWTVIAGAIVQLVASARAANGLLAALIGASFVVRGIGDFLGKTDVNGLHQPAWMSALSPFGWLQATRPLTHPEWWPLLIPAVVSLVLTTLAFWLLSRRDVGAGLLPSRAGKVRASVFLRTPLGLTWHSQRNSFIGWFIGVITMVATIGVLVPQMDDMYQSSESMKATIEAIGGQGALIPSFMSAMLAITALLVFAYALQAIGRLRSEETSGHLENIFATKLSRLKWLGLQVGVVLVGGAVMLLAAGALLAVLVNLTSDYTLNVVDYMLAGLAYAPVMALFVGAYVLLFGVWPRVAGLITWLYFGYVAFMAWIGPILQLDDWLMNISVLHHLGAPPVESVETLLLTVVSVSAVIFLLVGALLWRGRDTSN